uniref:Uncharacterized protein n=1 Tax=Anguilla anguilla TaxID=7936 RepID=A0A0E9VBQ9_ANGAN
MHVKYIIKLILLRRLQVISGMPPGGLMGKPGRF